MSLIRSIQAYEELAKSYSLSHLVSQFSGILAVDYEGNIKSSVTYFADDAAVRFKEVLTEDAGPTIVERTKRAWALPGYLIETVRNPTINPGIQLPTLPDGTVLNKPADILLITTVPYYWYPQVPEGDRLKSYDIKFSIPFIDLKNNRQLFKVAQNNILDEQVLVIQLSSIPAYDITAEASGGTLDFNFTT